MPRPSATVNRDAPAFVARAHCQADDCTWSRYAAGARPAMIGLQQHVRDHVRATGHHVKLNTHRTVTYAPVGDTC